jgi:Domain of unknown function (DUF1844)
VRREAALPNEKPTPKELKVTDKRIFTPEGDIREEFQNEIRPIEPHAAQPSDAPPAQPNAPPRPPEAAEAPRPAPAPEPPKPREERRRSLADKATSPGTPFANFIQSLVAQAYMFLGMLRDPRQPQPIFDAEAAHETIDILALLKEKTAGNLTPEEEDFFEAHLGDLKLAYVQRTKNIG